ncbi:unnamed protein product [Phyllotreta striolata]|uniref:Major facilitator superfamily associated domain-containing protein n=1 Tax=Phyllotreta striolata TaxID=444603 RepID=A0A9N9XPQ0_PHYSR|nr:unnamed protein product [Phyllotreta striolata]
MVAMQHLEINKKLLPLKAHYLLWNAGIGPVTPYLTSYIRQLGFSSIIVGVIYTIIPICGMLAKPVLGSIADRFHCQKLLFLFLQLLTAAAFLGVFFSPKVDVSRQANLTCYDNNLVLKESTTIKNCSLDDIRKENGFGSCKLKCRVDDDLAGIFCNDFKIDEFCHNHPISLSFSATISKGKTTLIDSSVILSIHNITLANGTTYDPICPKNNAPFSSRCDIDCADDQIQSAIPEGAIEDDKVTGMYQFWILLIFMIFAWVGQAACVSIGDAICFELLGDKPERYGYQRMWGSFGWGVVSALTGFLIDFISKGAADKNYSIAFYTAAAILALDFAVSTQIKYDQKRITADIFRDVGRLLLNIRVLIFLVWCLAVGMCTGLVWQFLFWLVEDLAGQRGCSGMENVKTLEGLIQGVHTVFGEAPFFFISGRIIKRMGHVNTMSLVLFGIGVRFCLLSVIKDPWYFLPVELLNGISFGLFFACMASYASIIAPVGTEATMQGLIGAVFEGVGVSVGSSIAGSLYSKHGGAITFRIYGIGCFVLCFVHVIVQYLLRVSGSQDIKYKVPKDALRKISLVDEKELTLLCKQ